MKFYNNKENKIENYDIQDYIIHVRKITLEDSEGYLEILDDFEKEIKSLGESISSIEKDKPVLISIDLKINKKIKQFIDKYALSSFLNLIAFSLIGTEKENWEKRLSVSVSLNEQYNINDITMRKIINHNTVLERFNIVLNYRNKDYYVFGNEKGE